MTRIVVLALASVALSAPAGAAVLTVDTTIDGNDGECSLDCTLREAVATALSGDTILVPAGSYSVTLGAIVIGKNLTITGDGAAHTIIRAGATPQRAFMIDAGASVEISSLSLSLDPAQPNGGGIRNSGDLELRDCWLRDSRNPQDLGGGALRVTASGTATVRRCTMSNNNAEFGGAIINDGVLLLEETTVSGNSNSFAGGGILHQGGTLTLDGCTIVNNVADLDGAANIHSAIPTVTLRNTVVHGGVGGPDCTGPIDATDGYNLDGDGMCVASGGPGNLTAPAKLGPLTDNGGPVPTHAPASDSPLLDAGNPAAPGSADEACSISDARGVGRPRGAACDIGAYELALGQNCAGGAADDEDGDGVCAADDNCPAGFNPAQDAVVFPHTVFAETTERFGWSEPEDVAYVRGDLDQVASYATNDGGDLTNADSLTDPTIPAAGSGFYYLFRLGGACVAGSWQTRPGGEPERDAALP